MKYIILRKFISIEDCDTLQESFLSEQKCFDINLKNDKDLGNVLYKSSRSENLNYKYVKDSKTKKISEKVKSKLSDLLNVSFDGSINDLCLPMFSYGINGSIKAHRGVQKEKDSLTYQTFVGVCQLTQRGEDFEGGEFYINSKASASKDGKEVFNNLEKDRFYPMLNKGDICLIYNPELVHGVNTVKSTKYGKSFRLTCSWRTNSEQ